MDRLSTLSTKPPEADHIIYSDLPAEILAMTLVTLKEIQDDPDSYIDEGGAASVHRLPGGYCMKVMFDRHHSPHAAHMRLGNTVAQESAYLRTVQNLTVENVRTPRYVGRIEIEGGPNIIIMEELRAVNLQHVLNGTAQAPDTFHPINIVGIADYIMEMAELFKVAHMDLEPRNVMIDIETGDPYLIDFGRARSLQGLRPEEKITIQRSEDEAVDRMYVAVRDWFDKELGGVGASEIALREHLYKRLDSDA